MTEEEWSDLLSFASCLKPPHVQDEHCTTCHEYSASEMHFECGHLMKRVPLFLELSKSFVHILTDLTVKEVPKVLKDYCNDCKLEKVYGSICLCSNVHKSTLDRKYIILAFGKISRTRVLQEMLEGSMVLLKSDHVFRNIKACLRLHIEDCVLNSFDDVEFPQTLDCCTYDDDM